jgi:hypothetical protein
MCANHATGQALFIDPAMSGRWSSLRTDSAAALTVVSSRTACRVHDNIGLTPQEFVSSG